MADAKPDDLDNPAELTERIGAFSPFRIPIFRAIWIANLFSNLGATIQAVGAAWMMTSLTDSHQLIGLVQASATVPIMLFGMIAGAIADNFDRRRVMLSAQVGMLATSAVLATMTYAGLITPILLLAFTLTVGIGTALNSPAWQASVRQQVDRRELPQAIALNSIAFNIARSVGPALGGLLISIWDVSLAFAINAISYCALIFVLLRWRPEARKVSRRPIFPAIAIGLRYCAGSLALRRILLRGLVVGFGLAGYQSMLPVVVRERLHGSEIEFGLMLGMFGVGSIVAAPFIGQIRRRLRLEGIVTLGALIFVIVMSALAELRSVTLALPFAFIAGTAWVALLTSINTAVQMRSPDEILGRCLSIYQAITFGGMAIGSWAWGAIADVRDLPFALHSASVFLIVSFVILRIVAPLPKPGEGVVQDWQDAR
ncbi:MAG: MFS transporter [Novosphingobium sp.]|nr:MFS transporter [Novosphingobium sp.]